MFQLFNFSITEYIIRKEIREGERKGEREGESEGGERARRGEVREGR